MARALMADPDLPKKARDGKAHLIYHCVACNQGCFDSIFQAEPAACLVNPRAGREGEFKAIPASKPKHVLVIGGGPAGLKAACTLAERRHRVTMVERERALGGQLLLNRPIPGRGEMLRVARDLISNIKALDVDILLGTEAHPAFIKEMNPDAVVLATGARPIKPDIPGIDSPRAVLAWDLLSGKKGVGKNVVVVGGNALGLETALYLASHGTLSSDVLHFLMINRAESIETLTELLDKGNKRVTVLEMTKKIGQDIGLSTRWTVKAELKRLGVNIRINTKAVGITPEGLEVETGEGRGFLPADSIVIAAGSKSENTLAKDLEDLVPEVYTIGDAKEPRNALEALWEGFQMGLNL
jgi:2,4-dienoyl-CoA reductase (NADPH2)